MCCAGCVVLDTTLAGFAMLLVDCALLLCCSMLLCVSIAVALVVFAAGGEPRTEHSQGSTYSHVWQVLQVALASCRFVCRDWFGSSVCCAVSVSL